jgi:hypothetical protein
MSYTHPSEAPTTLRLAGDGDRLALSRLATLDSATVPAGPLVVAEVGGELWAAVAVESGATIADPFRPSAEVAELAAQRAASLRAPRPRTPWLRLRLRLALRAT